MHSQRKEFEKSATGVIIISLLAAGFFTDSGSSNT
jgi:hypothetical protein